MTFSLVLRKGNTSFVFSGKKKVNRGEREKTLPAVSLLTHGKEERNDSHYHGRKKGTSRKKLRSALEREPVFLKGISRPMIIIP